MTRTAGNPNHDLDLYLVFGRWKFYFPCFERVGQVHEASATCVSIF